MEVGLTPGWIQSPSSTTLVDPWFSPPYIIVTGPSVPSSSTSALVSFLWKAGWFNYVLIGLLWQQKWKVDVIMCTESVGKLCLSILGWGSRPLHSSGWAILSWCCLLVLNCKSEKIFLGDKNTVSKALSYSNFKRINQTPSWVAGPRLRSKALPIMRSGWVIARRENKSPQEVGQPQSTVLSVLHC